MDRLKIIVCDDEVVQQRIIRALLEKYLKENEIQAELKFYASGRECLLEKGELMDTDIFLLDIFMPELNGIDIARELKNMGAEGKIIFITGEMITLRKLSRFMLFPIFRNL